MNHAGLCALVFVSVTLAACSAPKAPTATSTAAPAKATSSHFNALALFAPFAHQYPVNRYRSADGRPGPDYWQNRADYSIQVTLDPESKVLTGSEVITYTNNSPQALGYVWLQLDQNIYKPGSRGSFAFPGQPDASRQADGDVITAVQVEAGGSTSVAKHTISDTRMRVDLPKPVAGNGGTVKLHIAWHYTMPESGGRTNWYTTKDGDVFEIAQWYPRMAVYDDLRGWDTLPYVGSEFYLEYGDFDYAITVPANMIVAGSGELVNPADVLTPIEQQRLAQARTSDATVVIRTPEDVANPASRPSQGTRTWRFRMHDSRDVAFGASAAYVWDAARINLPDGNHAMAQSVYPTKSIVDSGWQHSTQHIKYTVEFFSKYTGLVYPWPNAIAEAGNAGGMEYPGIVFDSWKSTGKNLFMLTVHEIGHDWYPMIVGSNERRAAWMDEGFNTFVDALAQADWGKAHNGEFAPKQDGEYAPLTGDPAKDIVTQVFDDPNAPTILAAPDVAPGKYRHPISYFKAAYGLTLLREAILGPERFDAAFSQYTHDWAFKHPSPSDFFRAMDSAAGEDLSWFWRGWFAHNWKLDLAVTGVKYVDNDPAKGAQVMVANLERMAMPSTLKVTFADGSTTDVRVPVEAWMRNIELAVPVPGGKRIKSATIDPDALLPDVNRANNAYPAASKQ